MDLVLDNLRWLGHDGFCLVAGGKTIYFDPYEISDDCGPADIILVTHEHYDHCSLADIKKIRQKNTVLVTEKKAAAKAGGKTVVLAPGDRHEIDGIVIEAVWAYNLDKKFHPREKNWVGFVVTVDGVRLYHAGDTDHIPEMKDIICDIAMLPVSGTYTMTAEEAAEAALEINPKVVIPMHYGRLSGTLQDAERFAELLSGKIRVILPSL